MLDLVREYAAKCSGLVSTSGRPAVVGGVDMMVVDAARRSDLVYGDLVRYAPAVCKYIAATGVSVPPARDDGGGLAAVRGFLIRCKEWVAVRHDKGGEGVIVLSKLPEDRSSPAGLVRKALNFTKALAAHAADGNRLVDDATWELRMAECLTCPKRVLDACAICGCPLETKTSWAEQSCPDTPPRWEAQP